MKSGTFAFLPCPVHSEEVERLMKLKTNCPLNSCRASAAAGEVRAVQRSRQMNSWRVKPEGNPLCVGGAWNKFVRPLCRQRGLYSLQSARRLEPPVHQPNQGAAAPRGSSQRLAAALSNGSRKSRRICLWRLRITASLFHPELRTALISGFLSDFGNFAVYLNKVV